MIKTLPLFLIPSIFFIFFINVENLTSKIDENLSYKSNYNITKEQLDKDKEVKDNLDNNIKEDKKKIELDKQKNSEKIKTIKQIEIKKNMDIAKSKKNIDLSKEFKEKELVKKIEQKKELKIDNTIKNKVKIQFGAFSKLKNAEKHQKFVTAAISKEFPELTDKIKINNENKLYKVLYQSESIGNARALCEFSKSKKISCLILKK